MSYVSQTHAASFQPSRSAVPPNRSRRLLSLTVRQSHGRSLSHWVLAIPLRRYPERSQLRLEAQNLPKPSLGPPPDNAREQECAADPQAAMRERWPVNSSEAPTRISSF